MAVRVRDGKALKNDQDAIALVPPPWVHQAIELQVKRSESDSPF
jgi:hypothetical protein